MANSITGSIKFFNSSKKFGFATVNDEDYFIHFSTVAAAGFEDSDMATGAIIEFIPETVDSKKRVSEIKRIGLELARPTKTKKTKKTKQAPKKVQQAEPELPPVEINKPLVGTVDNYVEDRGFGFLSVEGYRNIFFHVSELQTAATPIKGGSYYFIAREGKRGPVATLVQHYKRTKVDAHDGKGLFSIKLDGYVSWYEIESADGDVSTVNSTCLEKARSVLGKTIAHPVPENAGVATNDPAVSQSMKGSGSGSGKKKAA